MRGPETRLSEYPLAENQPPQAGRRDRPRITQLSEKQLRNFWRRVHKTKDCWEWTGGHNGAGRSLVKLYGVQLLTPRVAYALHFGVDPGYWDVLHTCDNPDCVNPAHLFLGTHQYNTNDMVKKGRFVASRGRTKIKPNSPEESILLDVTIPVSIAAQHLGVHRKTVWQRRKAAVA